MKKKLLLGMLVMMTAGSVQGKWGSEYVHPQVAVNQLKAHPWYAVSGVVGCALLYLYGTRMTREAKRQCAKLQQKFQRKAGQDVRK